MQLQLINQNQLTSDRHLMSQLSADRRNQLIKEINNLMVDINDRMLKLQPKNDNIIDRQNKHLGVHLTSVIRSIDKKQGDKPKVVQIERLINFDNAVRIRVDFQHLRLIDKKSIDLLSHLYDENLDNVYKSEKISINEKGENQEKHFENIDMILIQSKESWQEHNLRVSTMIDRARKQSEGEKKSSTCMPCFSKEGKKKMNTEVSKKIDELVATAFFLIEYWRFKEIPYRIICINGERKQQNSNFYIYYDQGDSESLPPLNQASSLILRQKIVAAHLAIKQQNNIDIISRGYMQGTKANLIKQLIFKSQEGNQEELVQSVHEPQQFDPSTIVMKTLPKIEKGYPRDAIMDFVGSWKRAAHFAEKYSKTFVCIQPTHIYIPKTDHPKSVSLLTNNQPKQNFNFVGQNSNYFVFESINKPTYIYNIQEVPKNEISFMVEVEDAPKKKNILSNKINPPKTENQILGFGHELQLFPNNKLNMGSSYFLLFQTIVKRGSKHQIPTNLSQFRKGHLLTKIGKIPNIYGSHYAYNYTPQIHQKVSQILQGTPTQIDSKNFHTSVVQVIKFYQDQDNKSQNYCEHLKITGYKQKKNSGFVMKDRYIKYSQYLHQFIQQVKLGGGDLLKKSQIEVSKDLRKRHLANLNDDMSGVQVANVREVSFVLEKFIIYQYLSNKNGKSKRQPNYNISMIKIADRIVQIYNRRQDGQGRYPNMNDLSIFFISFMEGLYPYHTNLNILRQDLTNIRLITQKYIPQFNYLLNRKGVGLENYASSQLLEFYTALPMELGYRIWDYMVANIQGVTQTTRLIPLYTIMLHQEKSEMIPIFPINQIINSIHINATKIKFDTSGFQNASKIIDDYTQKNKQRQNKIVQLAKESYLRKFAFGKNAKKNSSNFDEEQYQANAGDMDYSYINSSMIGINKTITMKDPRYPLPIPGFGGYDIQKVYLFIGGVFLLGNLNLRNGRVYKLQINMSGGSEIKDQPITDKASFINKFIQLERIKPRIMEQIGLVVEFRLIESPNLEVMSAKLKLDGYHKDVVYRENVNLNRSKKFDRESTTLVSSIMNLALIIKSCNSRQKQRQNWQELNRKQVQVYEKLLDFDLSPSNSEVVKAVIKLDKFMGKIIDPLDQLNEQKYLNLKISTAFRNRQPQWIHHSKLSIEQLKANFTAIFYKEAEKQILLNVAKFYQSYAENYQQFELGQFLIDLILMAPITKLKKLSMIFCLCIHYQNIYQGGGSQKMSIETLNSLIGYMLKSTGYINACPFTNKYFGRIIYACYYQKGSKSQENKKEITEIIQDWLYIAQLNSNYSGIILGSLQYLSVLRSMLPSNVLNKIQQESQCRFEIHYQLRNQIYVWAATVNTVDFCVINRGVKFLNNFPKYVQNQEEMSSVAEVMHNCEDMISLQSHCPIDYYQFQQVFKENALFNYILSKNQYLTQASNTKDKTQNVVEYKLKTSVVQGGISSNEQSQMTDKVNKEEQNYDEFAIYRHQNCIPSWKRCMVTKDEGNVQISVKYKDKQGEFVIPRYEIILLSAQNSGRETFVENSESSISNKQNAF